eukprot:CAMPEP_0171665948 /NCGR_PEP_ID=MMETSP0990-20121206/47797_1 /TAXON_ID=483369 /ORGANISM="non described non described, Strain CCMP2098" /LENGTH=46 /DNA_ID= /DNA_START= /DNA_END= /DNA_ORIENTATION=
MDRTRNQIYDDLVAVVVEATGVVRVPLPCGGRCSTTIYSAICGEPH